jgi:hypothetical protein
MVKKRLSPTILVPDKRNVGAAQRFIQACQSSGKISFTINELSSETGLSSVAAREQLKRLKDQVVRVSPRQDFFLIVSPDQLPMGAPPAYWWLDSYFQTLRSPYYIALLTAAAEYGSTQQAIQVVQVMTDKPLRELRVGRIRIQFFVKKNVGLAPTSPLRHAYAPLKVSTPETTALDLLRYAWRIGGVDRAAQVIKGLLSQFTKTGLRQALQIENELSTIQRLGFMLEHLDRPDLCLLIENRLPQKLNLVLLEHHKRPHLTTTLPISNRWSVIINTDLNELS